jgi:hypothetical protein
MEAIIKNLHYPVYQIKPGTQMLKVAFDLGFQSTGALTPIVTVVNLQHQQTLNWIELARSKTLTANIPLQEINAPTHITDLEGHTLVFRTKFLIHDKKLLEDSELFEKTLNKVKTKYTLEGGEEKVFEIKGVTNSFYQNMFWLSKAIKLI